MYYLPSDVAFGRDARFLKKLKHEEKENLSNSFLMNQFSESLTLTFPISNITVFNRMI